MRSALFWPIIAALALGACNQAAPENPNSTVKVKLPASRPDGPRPGFSSEPDNVVSSDFQPNFNDQVDD